MEATIEQEAILARVGGRSRGRGLAAPRAEQLGLGVDDNLMVWVSRLIDQDVNMFVGARLLDQRAQSVRIRCFQLAWTPPSITPSPCCNEAASVTRERIGDFEYSWPRHRFQCASSGSTVPLTSRQRDIDDQLDTLDRRALLGASLHPRRRWPWLLDGRANLRSSQSPDARDQAHCAWRSRCPHRRDFVRRAAAAGRGIQQHGCGSAAPAW